jgi:nicotinamide mononucleotide transporter
MHTDYLLWIEIAATVLSLGFLVLLIRQVIWCWPLAIASGLLSIYLFVASRLYSEAILYGYYVVIAMYGWWNWSRPGGPRQIRLWKAGYHLIALLCCVLASFALGYTFKSYADADYPFLDATTSIFSFLASILEAHKILSTWIYWIVINALTAGMYFSKSLHIYAVVMIVYFIMSIVGYRQWRRDWQLNQTTIN